MPVEGILRNPVGGHLLPDGFYLYRTLSSMYEVILVTDEPKKQNLKDWLAMEGIFKYAQIVFPDYTELTSDTPAMSLRRHIYLQGYKIDFWVCNDPEFARDLITIGETAMLFVRPAYTLPEWHPDGRKGGPTWDDLVDKVLQDKAARAADTRTEIGDGEFNSYILFWG